MRMQVEHWINFRLITLWMNNFQDGKLQVGDIGNAAKSISAF